MSGLGVIKTRDELADDMVRVAAMALRLSMDLRGGICGDLGLAAAEVATLAKLAVEPIATCLIREEMRRR